MFQPLSIRFDLAEHLLFLLCQIKLWLRCFHFFLWKWKEKNFLIFLVSRPNCWGAEGNPIKRWRFDGGGEGLFACFSLCLHIKVREGCRRQLLCLLFSLGLPVLKHEAQLSLTVRLWHLIWNYFFLKMLQNWSTFNILIIDHILQKSNFLWNEFWLQKSALFSDLEIK